METSTTAKQAIIEQIVTLMEDTGKDMVDLILEVFVNWDDADLLALFPENRLKAALAYLQHEQADQQDDEAGDEELDLS